MFEIPREWPEAILKLVRVATESGRVIAIREALKAIRALPLAQQGKSFKLGICRTFTVETQIDAVSLGLVTLPCRPEIRIGDLENIEQLLLDVESPLLRFEPDALLVLWRLEELCPHLFFEHNMMSAEDRKQASTEIINRIERLCMDYAKVSAVPLFLSTFSELTTCGLAMNDIYSSYSPRYLIFRMNQVLLDLAARYAQIHLFDFSSWVASEGAMAFDLKMDLYAHQPIANRSLMSFSAALRKCFRPLLQAPSKVLAVDLDNVLWGGILGEDGMEGIKIGHDFPGNIYRRIQQHVLSLKHRGVLLVLLSKNNLADVEQAFSKLPDMPLKLDDFVALRVNWQEKYQNLKNVAQELNLGLDSFVFVDDQEFERQQMQFNLPEVSVLATSEDPLQTLRALIYCRAFDAYRVSDEDSKRSTDYVAQTQRRKLESSSQEASGFLYTLQLQARIMPVNEAMIPRVMQMIGKTNQFNLTTRRHLEAKVRRMLANSDNVLRVLSLSDRFGDQGIVGLVIALGDLQTGVAKIDSFLLSCRAIGRGAEQALWFGLASKLLRMGYKFVHAEYLRTEKNSQVADLYDRLGMNKLDSSNEEHSHFSFDLSLSLSKPEWINIVEEVDV